MTWRAVPISPYMQESAHRTLNRTLKGAEKSNQGGGGGEGGGGAGEGAGRLEQVTTAIEQYKLSLQLFEQLQKVAPGRN